ncbi:unnamed protein product [Timema podura]|uniref:Uncharacterized protein n=1 Tax=Timema podura TaxID=61482 RepID=A0ABN7NUT6_TIMPD|nr:unnamed protein product [Timema podura]
MPLSDNTELVKGKASNESSGVITAIANQVARLEPGSKPPIILLENDNRCIQAWSEVLVLVTAGTLETRKEI